MAFSKGYNYSIMDVPLIIGEKIASSPYRSGDRSWGSTNLRETGGCFFIVAIFG